MYKRQEYQKKQLFYAEKMNALITSLLSDIFRGEELAIDARDVYKRQVLDIFLQLCFYGRVFRHAGYHGKNVFGDSLHDLIYDCLLYTSRCV